MSKSLLAIYVDMRRVEGVRVLGEERLYAASRETCGLEWYCAESKVKALTRHGKGTISLRT